jgi:hypothetical protein
MPSFGHLTAQGEFRGLVRWLTGHSETPKPQLAFEPHRPMAGIDAQSEDPRDDSLSALLGSIADDVQHRAAAARDGVMADFTARARHARKHLSPNLVAATLAAIKESRKAALALINQNAASELAGRKKTVIAAWRAGAPAPVGRKRGRDPSDARPELR